MLIKFPLFYDDNHISPNNSASQNGQESKSSFVNHTDNFGFNCLDYATIHSEKKDIFEGLLLRHGAVNCVSPEKLIHVSRLTLYP